MNKGQIKLGISPINWMNDDDPSLGEDIDVETCLSQMQLAGYEGCEVGHRFPKDPVALQALLKPYSLSVASAWFSTYFTEENNFDVREQIF